MKSHEYVSSENVKNVFQGCVNLKIDWAAKRGNARAVRMHVSFGEHEDEVHAPLTSGTYSLAIRRGKLILKIENGYSPEETWNYTHQIPTRTEAKVTRSESMKEVNERAGELTSEIGFEGPAGKAIAGSKASERHSKEISC